MMSMSIFFILPYLSALVLLLVMILALATGLKQLHRISGWIFAPAGLIGLGMYLCGFLMKASTGSGFTSYTPAIIRSVIQAAYATCAMFLGRQDYDAIEPLLQQLASSSFLQDTVAILFWLVHLGALFVTASALLSTLGKKLLQTLRLNLLFLGSRKLFLIFGLNEQSATLGRDLVLLLGEEESSNIGLAQAMIRYLVDCGISPNRVSIDLRCSQELDYVQLKQFEDGQENRYDVNVFCDAELSARLLVHESPPHEVIEFDANGVAQNDFHALIIGFDQVGQHTLGQIIMNGQFYGSRFTADVVDIDADTIDRRFLHAWQYSFFQPA